MKGIINLFIAIEDGILAFPYLSLSLSLSRSHTTRSLTPLTRLRITAANSQQAWQTCAYMKTA